MIDNADRIETVKKLTSDQLTDPAPVAYSVVHGADGSVVVSLSGTWSSLDDFEGWVAETQLRWAAS